MSELCLTLVCPPTVEEKLLDLLLLSPNVSFFTSTVTAAHGMAHENMDQTEQVLGRSRAIEIQVILSAANKASLLDSLRQQFSGAGLRYWLSAVTEAGEIA
ncbi:MAG: DUF3240 domain-containing protein [Sulfuriferula multivorans]|uniref:DUF3240 domain-containing protein n=1 Tax=Sulfuriferula multivorans TaxID=1559896 RepID=A0A7C9NTH7_9PROT|nr:DUF3240 domain-containing protein [Sulfuriferula multivorans]